MRLFLCFIHALGLFSLAQLAYAHPADIGSINYSNTTPLSLSLELPSAAQVICFTLSQPSRLVIDLKNTQLSHALTPPPADHPLFQNIRSGIRNGNMLRIVVKLKADAEAKSKLLQQGAKKELQIALTLKNLDKIGLFANPVAAAANAEPNKSMAITSSANKQTEVKQQPAKSAVKTGNVKEPEQQAAPATLKVSRAIGDRKSVV